MFAMNRINKIVEVKIMRKILETYIINNININVCLHVLQIIESNKNDLYLLCGGMNECVEIIQLISKGAGITKTQDDEYIIKLLKNRDLYLSGKWIFIDDVCIAGIDAKNPVQNIESIYRLIPKKCSIYLLLSVYPLTSNCSKKLLAGKELDIGLPNILIEKLLSSMEKPLIFISCSELINNICVHRFNKNLIYIAIPENEYLIKTKIFTENNEIIVEINRLSI